ncbi:MAG: class I SAM-dependent methyltransferase [Pyrinomonadaceae bacterium]|nr:class I SAM-dependent methyltransferase [Pyrinomonadaceae bacterium]
MQEEDFRYLYALEDSFWWFVGMREITFVLLDPILGPSQDRLILDAGCGTGGMLAWLARFAGRGRVVGIDVVPRALRFCRDRHHTHLAQASATHLPFVDSKVDLVTSFDVLVQLPGEGADEAAIREMHRVLRPGGVAFVRVAAYEWMRSGHDDALGTQRRYTLRALTDRMESAGFSIVRATYANALLLPAAALRRLVLKRVGLADSGSDVKPLPPKLEWLNRVLASALVSEARILRNPRASLPAGLSIICIGRKSHN